MRCGLRFRCIAITRYYGYFDTISEEIIKNIENDLNNRPRKALKFKMPNEVTPSSY